MSDVKRPFKIRQASEPDATCLAALAVQVFLDTYATDGIFPALARDALREGGVEGFAQRLAPGSDPCIDLAVDGANLLGFVETVLDARAPLPGIEPGAELVRLYVQSRFHRCGIGRALLQSAERRVRRAGLPTMWLTAWQENTNAIAFYTRCGLRDVGEALHAIEDGSYVQRVLVRCMGMAGEDLDDMHPKP